MFPTLHAWPECCWLQGALILKILQGKYPAVQGYGKELTEVIKAALTLVSQEWGELRGAAPNLATAQCKFESASATVGFQSKLFIGSDSSRSSLLVQRRCDTG